MVFVLTFLLIAGLEIAVAHDDSKDQIQDTKDSEAPADPDLCVGCDKKDEPEENPSPQLTVEIRIDPVTGKVQYVIRGIQIDQ